ncbi:hypothetical protein HK414_04040 [Ramlibacter terrae]|uniref:Uncharacterized protein n=1 Tax=Ramlibacter terrae TaxID=2732511 RepID=A0ABX6P3L7_9BURK|nr:hypothetical protein HK414_04040 [Ramlibacter terrae]
MNRLLPALALLACAHASAQHHAHSPYAGEEARDIKALSARESVPGSRAGASGSPRRRN